MYCKNCGSEIDDRAVVCPKCGVATGKSGEDKASGLSIAALVLAFFIPLVGLILGIVAKKDAGEKSAKLAKAAIIVSVVFMVLNVLVYVLYGAVILGMLQGSGVALL